ncbi:MAG: ABATE domain-containing protein [Actinomycetota bacterium]
MSRIPEHLQLLEDFVNTNELDGDEEAFKDPTGLSAWFDERGIAVDGPSDGDVAKAIEVREAMRSLMAANNGEPMDAQAADVLNAFAAGTSLTFQIGADGRGSLEPAGSGIDRALGSVLGAMFESMADGSWANMKACRADTCRWAFYDATKNHSKTWCSMSVCGNRAKARSYREKHEH